MNRKYFVNLEVGLFPDKILFFKNRRIVLNNLLVRTRDIHNQYIAFITSPGSILIVE